MAGRVTRMREPGPRVRQVRGRRYQGQSLRNARSPRCAARGRLSRPEPASVPPPTPGGAGKQGHHSRQQGGQCSRDEPSRDPGWRVVLGEPRALPPSLPRHRGGPTGAWLPARGGRPQNLQAGGWEPQRHGCPQSATCLFDTENILGPEAFRKRDPQEVSLPVAVPRLRVIGCVVPSLHVAVSTAQNLMKRHPTSESPKKHERLANRKRGRPPHTLERLCGGT